MISIKKFVFNPFFENTYLIWETDSLDAAIIDPGCFTLQEEDEIKNFISSKNLKLRLLINTHCHIDHVFGCKFIKDNFQTQFLVPENELPLLENMEQQAAFVGMENIIVPKFDVLINENTEIKLGNEKIIVLDTPGHTPGEISLYMKNQNYCLTGDVLFENSIGRTDLTGGDYKTLMNSIRKKLLVLPDETVIFPGHGLESTIGKEKKYNPFLQQINNYE